jgi:hypothetical protein
MDDDISKIIRKIFPSDDAKIVEKMLQVVDKDSSDSNKANRINLIEYIINSEIK